MVKILIVLIEIQYFIFLLTIVGSVFHKTTQHDLNAVKETQERKVIHV